MGRIFYKWIPYGFYTVSHIHRKKKNVECNIKSHTETPFKLLWKHRDSDPSLRFGERGREEGKTAWTGLTWVHRAEKFPDSKGNEVWGKPEQKLEGPHKSFTPSSKAALPNTQSIPNPHAASPCWPGPCWLSSSERLPNAPWNLWNQHIPRVLGRQWRYWISRGLMWATNTSLELRQGDTVEALPARSIKHLLNIFCTENAHLLS